MKIPKENSDHEINEEIGRDIYGFVSVLRKSFTSVVNPDGRTPARENRAFLRRVVRYLPAEAGIRQFLDIGTGLPASPTCTR